jgi:hypothetical protein
MMNPLSRSHDFSVFKQDLLANCFSQYSISLCFFLAFILKLPLALLLAFSVLVLSEKQAGDLSGVPGTSLPIPRPVEMGNAPHDSILHSLFTGYPPYHDYIQAIGGKVRGKEASLFSLSSATLVSGRQRLEASGEMGHTIP